MNISLPIDHYLERIVDVVRTRRNLVLVAEAGAGKTTRVPPALYSQMYHDVSAQVVVVEPRRLAARLAAQRVAQELGVELGGLVGYQIRFEDRTCPQTRIRFVTDGVMLRQLLSNPRQDKIGAVILDEFHERHLQADLIAALLRRLQHRERPDLAIVVMSATLDAEPIGHFFDAKVLHVPGRQHPIEKEYLTPSHVQSGSGGHYGRAPRLEAQVSKALRRIRQRKLDGHTLVFLPGAAEIRRAIESNEEWAAHHRVALEALHGNQPLASQLRALAPTKDPKVIMATNVAETSITIDGITAVVDSGLEREARHSPWSGLPTLRTVPISKASAEQRAGRAGRTGPGLCIRLYSEPDFNARRDQNVPEIQRADLCEMLLLLRSFPGVKDLQELDFFEKPPESALSAAEALLLHLGALEPASGITELGQTLARLPVHPRLGRLVVEARARGVLRQGSALTALLQERDIRLWARTGFNSDRAHHHDELGLSDCLARLEAYEAASSQGVTRERARSHHMLDYTSLQAARKTARHLERLLDGKEQRTIAEDEDQALLLSVLAAFPDRVGKRRGPRADEVVFAFGGSGNISPRSVVKEAESVEFLVAVEAEEDRRGRVVVRTASAIEPDWLIELFSDHIDEVKELRFNAKTERVEAIEELRYGAMVLTSTVDHDVEAETAAPLLTEAALAHGWERLFDSDAVNRLKERIAFAAQHIEELEPISEELFQRALLGLCLGCRSFADLRRASLNDALLGQLEPRSVAQLPRYAPEAVSIPGRRRVPVRYEPDRQPSIESYLQDFFGAEKGPAIAGGEVPLVLHLLAPNRRALQVTTDLSGFWDRHYPSIRKELMRRYPKHSWPEDPLGAEPVALRRRRR